MFCLFSGLITSLLNRADAPHVFITFDKAAYSYWHSTIEWIHASTVYATILNNISPLRLASFYKALLCCCFIGASTLMVFSAISRFVCSRLVEFKGCQVHNVILHNDVRAGACDGINLLAPHSHTIALHFEYLTLLCFSFFYMTFQCHMGCCQCGDRIMYIMLFHCTLSLDNVKNTMNVLAVLYMYIYSLDFV